jgi:hypothetical protein
MHAAFVKACAKLRLRPGSSESDLIALRIVALAKNGIRDARTLASLALLGMNTPTEDERRMTVPRPRYAGGARAGLGGVGSRGWPALLELHYRPVQGWMNGYPGAGRAPLHHFA